MGHFLFSCSIWSYNLPKEFGYKTKEDYLKGAQVLLSSPIQGDIIGYTAENYRRVRYNVKSNEIAIGNTGETNIDGGPNRMTLKEAKEAYEKGEKIY